MKVKENKPTEHIKPVKIEEPVRIMKTLKTEEVKPRVDEATLAKYADYLEEDEYNIRRESRSKHRDSSDEYSGGDNRRRKKNIKNKNVIKIFSEDILTPIYELKNTNKILSI